MSRRRQTIATRLLEVRQNTAMLTTFNEIDMTNVMAFVHVKKINSLNKMMCVLDLCHSLQKQ